MGEWVEVKGPDGAFKAYVARPSGTPKAAVVAIQEIFGVNAVMRGKADWLAREGFLAISPDLFWRIKPGIELTDQTDGEWKQAIDYMNQLDKNASVRDVQATLTHARGMGVSKAGCLGYCMGGYIAFLAACRTDTDASVAYHGGGIHTALGEAGAIKKPVLLHNPMKDSFIPVEALNTIRETLASNPLVTIYEYAEQDHAFTREGGAHYDEVAKQLADSRTISWLNREAGVRQAVFAALLALAACDSTNYSDTFMTGVAAVPENLPAFFDCLRENGATVVSAHRGGARDGLPENAISTFDAAVRQTPAFLEIDVRAARDGLVVMHDETVDRTTDGSGAIADMTVAQVQALTFDGGGHPPSLREALDWASSRTVLELDLKQDVRFEDVIAEVRAANAMGRVVFITYSVPAAARFAQLAPEAMLYVTITSASDLDVLEQRGVNLANVVAWTGDEEPNSELNIALAQRGVEARFGMFGPNAPANQAAAFAETGLQIISTDAPEAAVANLDANDGVEGYGALQCLAAD